MVDLSGPECQRLIARMDVQFKNGLRDFKFHIDEDKRGKVTAEEIAKDLNAMMDAYERGDTVPLDFNDCQCGKPHVTS